MPTSFEFLVFADPHAMHDAKVKTKIRKHAMKDIGASRRRPTLQPAKVALQMRHTIASPDGPIDFTPQHPKGQHLLLDNRALYDPHTRALSCQPDPFQSAIIPIDVVAHDLLQYFSHYSTRFPSNFTFTLNITRVFDSAIRDELMMNCILSAAASRLRYMQGTSPSHLVEMALSFTQQSLRLLQIRLHGDIPIVAASVEPLVDCILYLAAAALYRGDETSAGIHVGAAVRVIELNGGLEVLKDPRVTIRMLGMDDVLACMRLRPCSFGCTYDPGPLPPCVGDDSHANPRITNGLANVPYSLLEKALPEFLEDMMPQIVECDRLKEAEVPTYGEFSSYGLLVSHRQKLRILAVRNQLLALSVADLKTRAFRAVLIIWTLLPPNDPRQAKSAGVVAQHLMHMLKDSSSDDWAGFEKARLWCLMVGAFGTFIGGEDCTWFVDRVLEVILSTGQQLGLSLGPGLLQSLIDLQKRFLYRDTVTGPLTVRLVELLDLWSRIDGTRVVQADVCYL
jgi:hypothetical protein